MVRSQAVSSRGIRFGTFILTSALIAACGSEVGRTPFGDTTSEVVPSGPGEGPEGGFGAMEPTTGADGGTVGRASCDDSSLDTQGCGCAEPGQQRPCYTGPSTTRAIGICKDGAQVCSRTGELGGSWGACVGSARPAAEDCKGTADKNCDGRIGCADPSCASEPSCQPACKSGETKPCYGGPVGTLNKGICKAGVQNCVGGNWDNACTGQVLPAAEVCGDGVDNDCNAFVDCADGACSTLPACCKPTPVSVDGTIYANTSTALYRVDPTTFAVTRVGSFNTSENITDVAVTPAGIVYAISFTKLYTVNKTTGAATAVATVGGSANNSLTFLPGGQLLAADGLGALKVINPASGAVTTTGNYGGGYSSSGDLVSIASGKMFGTARASGSPSDMLVTINTTTGVATVVGATGTNGVWGLAYAGTRVIGFSTTGEVLNIDPATGASTVLASTGIPFWGAGQSPLVTAVDCK